MTEEVVIEKSESNPIVEREFAAMKDKLAEMESVHKELTSTHEEALATIAKSPNYPAQISNSALFQETARMKKFFAP